MRGGGGCPIGRLIGTYSPSILPHQDCCSFLIAEHPATKADPLEVEEMEKGVAWGSLLQEAIEGIEVREFRGLGVDGFNIVPFNDVLRARLLPNFFEQSQRLAILRS